MKRFKPMRMWIISACILAGMPSAVCAANPETAPSLREQLALDVLQKVPPTGSPVQKVLDSVRQSHEKTRQIARMSGLQSASEQQQTETETEKLEVCPNPGTSATKSYMDGAMVTNVYTDQYELLHHQMHVNDNGHYVTDDGYLGVALGSYFGPVGTKYVVTFANGRSYRIIKADAKADEDVYNGCYHRLDGSVIEFIIEPETAAKAYGVINGYVAGGNFNNVPEFSGEILEMRLVSLPQ